MFAVAVIDDLLTRGTLRQEGGQWRLDAAVADLAIALPEGLRQLVQDQIERLPEAERRTIEAASVVGPDFCVAAVAAALHGDAAVVEEQCVRLAQAGRLLRPRPVSIWPDGTASAGFGFVHALYWQGIYGRISQGRRAEWQARIGGRQEQAYGAHCAPIAAELAMRFEVAHDTERSLHYLQMAGAGALTRCAYHEGIELLRHALELVPQLSSERQPRQELELRLPLGAALMAAQGYASDEVEDNYVRALALCRQCARDGELERVLRGLWNVALGRAELDRARSTADELIVHAAANGNASQTFDAFAKLGQTCMHRGEFAAARRHLEYALSLPVSADDPTRQRELPRVVAYLAWVLWFTGHPAQALARADEALAQATAAAGPHSTAFVLGFVGWVHQFRGEIGRTRALAQQQRQLGDEHGLVYWRVWSDLLQGVADVHDGDPARGRNGIRQAVEAFWAMGAGIGTAHFLCPLADAEMSAGRWGAAREALEQAAGLLARHHNDYAAPEVDRLLGELALAESTGAAGDAEAECHFGAALARARQQDSRALELRAATSLAKLWSRQGRRAHALDLLTTVLGGFSEGRDTADLIQAESQLALLKQAVD